jgi:hypothetical protein
MLIEIGGRRYPLKNVEDLELQHILLLEHELATDERLQRRTSLRTVGQVQATLKAWVRKPLAERQADPQGMFLTCFLIWMARVLAGEDLTLVEAVSAPASSLRFIEEPSDHQAGEAAGKAPRPESRGGAKRRKRRR